MELKEVGGWESIEMVTLYAYLAPEHLHKNTVLVDRLRVTSERSYSAFTPQRKNDLDSMFAS